MSRPKTIGLAIVERLEEISELTGKVVYFQARTIEDEFTRRMAKASGKAVVVRLVEAVNQTPGKQTIRYAGKYTVSLFLAPTLTAKDAKDSDDLMEEIVEKLHGWWPDEVASNGLFRVACGTQTFPESAEYEIAVLNVEAPASTSKN